MSSLGHIIWLIYEREWDRPSITNWVPVPKRGQWGMGTKESAPQADSRVALKAFFPRTMFNIVIDSAVHVRPPPLGCIVPQRKNIVILTNQARKYKFSIVCQTWDNLDISWPKSPSFLLCKLQNYRGNTLQNDLKQWSSLSFVGQGWFATVQQNDSHPSSWSGEPREDKHHAEPPTDPPSMIQHALSLFSLEWNFNLPRQNDQCWIRRSCGRAGGRHTTWGSWKIAIVSGGLGRGRDGIVTASDCLLGPLKEEQTLLLRSF